MIRPTVKLLLATALLLPPAARAQKRQSFAEIPNTGFAYMHMGVGLGYPHALRIGADFIGAGHHQFTLGYTGTTRKSGRVPRGAVEETSWFDVSPFNHPQQEFSGVNIGYGYVLYLPNKDQVRNRFVLRGSLLLGKTTDIANVVIISNAGGIRYTYDIERTKTRGVLFEPRMEFIAAKGFGVGIGPYVVATNKMIGGGISANILFGYVSNYLRPINVAQERNHEERRKHPFRRPNPFRRPG